MLTKKFQTTGTPIKVVIETLDGLKERYELAIKFFEIVFSNINNKEKFKILIVGDSISSDIIRGKIAGIDTCWYNPNNIENKTDIAQNYEIENLKDLLQIV